MFDRRLTIPHWAEEDRPREKLLLKGASGLSDAELLAILIGSGSREETAVALSRRILRYAKDNLQELGKLSVDEFVRTFKGVGPAKAVCIVAAMELARRRKATDCIVKNQIQTSADVFAIFQLQLADLPHEEFWILLLNRANRIIDKINISRGGVSGTVVDVKIILKNALDKLASSVVLCHNHPSGNNQPSTEDKNLTKKIKLAFQAVDINLLDHIIVTDNNFYSFADEGIM